MSRTSTLRRERRSGLALVEGQLYVATQDALLRFPYREGETRITTPGVDPTNNLAEQAIRFVVIDRRITQGTRSEKGRDWSECIWTAIATCQQSGRNVMQFLQKSLLAHWHGVPPPSLLQAAH